MDIAEIDPMTFAENYRIEGDLGDVLIVTDLREKPVLGSQQPNYSELGHTGMSVYGSLFREDYNSELRGKLGALKYDKMRRNDSEIAMSLRLIKTPIHAARFYVCPASQSKRDKKIAERIWWNFNTYLSVSWTSLILEALSFLDFGWYAFEPVYELYQGQVVWKKFAARHPIDNMAWHYDPVDGGPQGATFFDLMGRNTFIPMKLPNGQTKLLTFTLNKEGGNMQGISALRPAYKNWYYKENLLKVDAIQKERHGIGIPLIKLPAGFSAEDLVIANNIGRNLRTNEKAHVVLPFNFTLEMLKLEGNLVDVIASVNYHDIQIARNVLAPFAFSERGITSAETQELFLKGAKFIADIICDVFNKWAIPDWVRFNYPNADLPELKVRRIGDTIDWRTISFAIRNLVGAGVLTPDDPMELFFRDEMDLPLPDKTSERTQATPQGQAEAKIQQQDKQAIQQAKLAKQQAAMQPTQSTANNMQKGTGKSNTGADGTGGK